MQSSSVVVEVEGNAEVIEVPKEVVNDETGYPGTVDDGTASVVVEDETASVVEVDLMTLDVEGTGDTG